MNIVFRALRKPPDVVLYRGMQEARIRGLWLSGGWRRLEQRVRRFWEPGTGGGRARPDHEPTVIAPDGLAAARSLIESRADRGAPLKAAAEEIRERRFEVFGARIPGAGPWPWNSDWRFAHAWPGAFFRSYQHWSPRTVAYDVKMPWEISRLGMLVPVLQWEALRGESGAARWVADIIEDWEAANPLAYSVNWHPMEASMRAVNLVVALDLLATIPDVAPEIRSVFRRCLTLQMEFVSRTIEYSDICANHYGANVTALILGGLALRRSYPVADEWLATGRRVFEREVTSQLLPDGVNFEKSIAYHRLVTELFLVAALALERAGIPVGEASLVRLRAAASYSRACRRPDGLAPNVGDNDGARVLTFDSLSSRDHAAVIGVAAARFRDRELKLSDGPCPVAVAWLLGPSGVATWTALTPGPADGVHNFPAGGVITVRRDSSFLWMDVGEVGLGGRGGHGHNDLLTFEFFAAGVPLLVDPGMPVYSGDLARCRRFRSTGAHNALAVDGVEMAPLGAGMVIGPDARPGAASIHEEADGGVVIDASHEGFTRLDRPTVHRRILRVSANLATLRCEDRLSGNGTHRVERFLQLAPNVEARLEASFVRLTVGGKAWQLTWDPDSTGRIEPAEVSSGYGVSEPSLRVVLVSQGSAPAELFFELQTIGGP